MALTKNKRWQRESLNIYEFFMCQQRRWAKKNRVCTVKLITRSNLAIWIHRIWQHFIYRATRSY